MHILRWKDKEDCACEGTVATFTTAKAAKAVLKKLKPLLQETHFYIEECHHAIPDPTLGEVLAHYKMWGIL